jgi:hypothetical protein
MDGKLKGILDGNSMDEFLLGENKSNSGEAIKGGFIRFFITHYGNANPSQMKQDIYEEFLDHSNCNEW